ncbi:hypothetical protein FSP39_001564 [Pinctada imbricata]|uniref:Uncharacterized protein n=1 Tax=Pinctada imbricata TaxID=66713 RepID=A0AA89BUK6_PINIB|nr:hypothetical protein FSP39_001564 [Pinctada imbricata]
METGTLTDDTAMNYGAQVAVESTSVTSKSEKPSTSKQVDPRRLKATECLFHNVKRQEDIEKCYVTGVLYIPGHIVVVDYYNHVLKLFDLSGIYVSSTGVNDNTLGITCVDDCTFATCGLSNTLYLWTLRGSTIVSKDVSYQVDDYVHGIHYNGTYYCVLHVHRDDNTITVLDRQGTQVRKIITKEAYGRTFKFAYDIHTDSETNNIYVPCWDEDGVLCMTIEGQALWFRSLSYGPRGITEIQGALCVADRTDICLHLIAKEGRYVRKLLDEEALGGEPEHLCYGQDDKLYISYDSVDDKHDIISVFTVTS